MTISERATAARPAMIPERAREMPGRLLTEQQVQAAFDVLTSPSADVGAARAMAIRTKFKAEKVWARLYRQASGTIDARKAWATEHEEYEAAMESYAVAEGRWEELKDARNKAELIMEAWRTMSSNERTVMRATR
jgi:hypothetical protein